MRESKYQSVKISKNQECSCPIYWVHLKSLINQQTTKYLIFLLLLTLHFLLFTVVTGCGKKAPPKPPQETAWVR